MARANDDLVAQVLGHMRPFLWTGEDICDIVGRSFNNKGFESINNRWNNSIWISLALMTLCLKSPLILHPLSHYSCCVRTHEQVESLNVKWSELCFVAQIEKPGEMLVARRKLPCSLWAYVWPFRTHSEHRHSIHGTKSSDTQQIHFDGQNEFMRSQMNAV